MDLIVHHNKLKAEYPETSHKELDCVYDWVSNRDFLTAFEADTKESWAMLYWKI